MQTKNNFYKAYKLNLLFLIIICFFSACKTYKQNITPQIDTDWSSIVEKALDDKYINYLHQYDALCRQKRDFEFDLSRKHRVLKSFDFDKHIKNIVFAYSGISFDSIVTINLFDHMNDEVEYPINKTKFILYKHNKILKIGYVSENDNEILIREYKTGSEKKLLLNNRSKQDGCEFGFIVICNLNINLKIISTKIIINPNDMFNVNAAQKERENLKKK